MLAFSCLASFFSYYLKLFSLSPWACLREAAPAKAGERVRVRVRGRVFLIIPYF
jgi:hypothetical protein